jgi:DNA-binding response OmpR family regulator
MKLLLIEDNIRLSERITYYLGKSFVVETATTGKEGKAKALLSTYSVIVLDLNLPDANGHDICKDLREAKLDTPIIIISGINEADSRVALLESGADDYLVKPFDPRELIARIHAVFRRHQDGYNRHIIHIKDLTIDVNRRHVERAGVPISLRRKEFDILEYLANNRGRAVTRNMILDHVWDTTKESWHNTVDVHIKYLRDKVDRPFESPLIKTAYGVGYMVDDSV